jgi:hypothetical protein
MELYFGETPLLVPQFFVYRRKQLELWKDVEIGFRVETYLGNFATDISIFIVLIDVCSAT